MKPLLLSVIFLLTLSFASAQTLRGVVTDSKSGETLIGASVIVSGTQNGASTDINGAFTIQYSGDFPVTLEVSFIGYSTKSVVVNNPNTPCRASHTCFHSEPRPVTNLANVGWEYIPHALPNDAIGSIRIPASGDS